MRNRIQDGVVLKVIAAAASAGDIVVIETMAGVAGLDTQADGTVPLSTQGVFRLPITAISGSDVKAGQKIYGAPNSVGSNATITVGSNILLGYATVLAPIGQEYVDVRLTP